MADATIASVWLKENKAALTKAEKQRRRDLIGRAGRFKGKELAFYSEFDRNAFGRMRWAENKAAKAGTFSPLTFLKEHVDYAHGVCLYMPFHVTGQQVMVATEWGQMSAPRAMCIMAHGRPKDTTLIVRHMCGNGHHSCVNPRHLVWGTTEQNARDRWLHTARPMMARPIERDTLQAMKDAKLPVNVLAVMHDIPAALIETALRKLEQPKP